MAPSLTDRLQALRLLLLDVDGVLTDGGIIYTDNGSEIKIFNAKDGLGIRLLQRAGVRTGIVTGRSSGALGHRCKNLDIDLIFDGTSDKGAVLEPILQKTRLTAGQVGFMGDDLPDLPLMIRVGTALAPADAVPEVIAAAHLVTKLPGGKGAVRDAAEAILKARGQWEGTVNRYRP